MAGRGRTATIVGGILVVVLTASGLAFVLGGGLDPVTPPTTASQTGAIPTSGLTSGSPSGSTSGATGQPTASRAEASPAVTSPSPSLEDGPRVATKAKRIVIDRLDIDLPIVEGDGIDAPIGKAAHFPSSGWPYGGTNIYIYGHARKGMFINLWDAKRGDSIVLKLVDGTSRTYVVTKVLPKVPWDAVEYLDPTKTEQLTLQTSTSYYATAPRFIVIAVPAT
jgi:LPXTG-site transpeptidase (sortase) family protein